jgi:hypothetical protein
MKVGILLSGLTEIKHMMAYIKETARKPNGDKAYNGVCQCDRKVKQLDRKYILTAKWDTTEGQIRMEVNKMGSNRSS